MRKSIYSSYEDAFESLKIRFWNFVIIRDQDECWEWSSSKFKKSGYGRIDLNYNKKRKTYLAHRLSYIIANNYIPKGLLVCHKCDNRLCCNPRHLFVGTPKDNAEDMVNKGRSLRGSKNPSITQPERLRRGVFHPAAKLSKEDIELIFSLRRGGAKSNDIAKKMGIKNRAVTDLLTGRTYSCETRDIIDSVPKIKHNTLKIDILEMKYIKLLKNNKVKNVNIAKMLRVCQHTISRILKSATYKLLEI